MFDRWDKGVKTFDFWRLLILLDYWGGNSGRSRDLEGQLSYDWVQLTGNYSNVTEEDGLGNPERCYVGQRILNAVSKGISGGEELLGLLRSVSRPSERLFSQPCVLDSGANGLKGASNERQEKILSVFLSVSKPKLNFIKTGNSNMKMSENLPNITKMFLRWREGVWQTFPSAMVTLFSHLYGTRLVVCGHMQSTAPRFCGRQRLPTSRGQREAQQCCTDH